MGAPLIIMRTVWLNELLDLAGLEPVENDGSPILFLNAIGELRC